MRWRIAGLILLWFARPLDNSTPWWCKVVFKAGAMPHLSLDAAQAGVFPTPWEVMVLSENEREQRVHSETLHDVATDVKPESAQCSQMRTSPRSLWGLLQVPYHRNSSWISEESIQLIQCLSGQQMAQKYIETENAVGCLYAPKSRIMMLFCFACRAYRIHTAPEHPRIQWVGNVRYLEDPRGSKIFHLVNVSTLSIVVGQSAVSWDLTAMHDSPQCFRLQSWKLAIAAMKKNTKWPQLTANNDKHD